MIGWLIALVLLLLLLWMRVGVIIRWESGEAVVKIRLGLFRFSLPADKPTQEKMPSRKDEPVSASNGKDRKKRLVKRWLSALWQQRQRLLALLGKLMKAPVMEWLHLEITIGNEDPAACAMEYGRIWVAIGTGMPVLENIFRVKKKKIDVICRYDLPETMVLAEAEITVRVYAVLALAGASLGLLYRVYRSTKITKKAVQNL